MWRKVKEEGERNITSQPGLSISHKEKSPKQMLRGFSSTNLRQIDSSYFTTTFLALMM